MAQPPDAAAAAVPPPVVIDRDVWHACAVPYSGVLPGVGTLVYYIPHGHIEQCAEDPALLLSRLPDPIHPVPCTVADLVLDVDAESGEAYTTISLLPGSHDDTTARRQVPAHGEPGLRFFEKQLSPADVTSNALVLPAGAEHVLPPLDIAAYQTARLFDVRDLRGKRFEFVHIWDKKRCRYMLGDLGVNDNDGWRGFVKAKRLATRDTVVFMRRGGGDGDGDGELLVGVRRAPRARGGHHPRPGVEDNKVVSEVWLAMQGVTPFEVTYYPREGTFEFVVSRDEYIGFSFSPFYPFVPGTTVHLRMNPLQIAQSISGTVRTFDHLRPWRMLEVDWDQAASPISYRIHRQVNSWQVLRQPQPAATTSAVRIRDAIVATPQVQIMAPPRPPPPTTTTGMVPSDDSYAMISLFPGDCYVTHRPLPAARDPVGGQREFCFFDKKLSPSDVAANGGGSGALFVIPKPSAAEHVLPRIPDLRVTDLQGGRWEFGHTWSDADTDRRSSSHTLAAGWSAFVKAKRLCVGDTVIFMRRRPGGEPLVGVRLLMNPDDARRRSQPPVYGTVRDVHSRSEWRMLEVDWDRDSPLAPTMNRRVNSWQVQPVQLALPPQGSDEEAAAATTSTAHAGDATTSAPSLALQLQTMASSSSSSAPIIPSRGSAFRIVNPRDGSQG
uniref:Auxin response factor n=1 Tax=Oryza barthii TaxID=65489 RepID=A0A0D3GN19_9ORYZ